MVLNGSFRYALMLSFLILAVIMLWSGESRADETGLKVFVEKRCYTCHTINAEADALEKEKAAFAAAKGVESKDKDEKEDEKKGGDLSDIGSKREKEWLQDFLKNPKDYFLKERKCKREAKKKYRKRFKGTDEEYETLINYLAGLKHESQGEGGDSCLKE